MQDPPPDRIWYLPHHPVENPNKPCKVRRVKNAASKFRGQSLNTNLFTGPDLLNSLLGVLMRFRANQIAVLADIEGMFMQIAINQTDQSALRFLWKNDNEIQQYQFTRLIFLPAPHLAQSMFWIIALIKTEMNIPKQSKRQKSLLYGWLHPVPWYGNECHTYSSANDSQSPGRRFPPQKICF